MLAVHMRHVHMTTEEKWIMLAVSSRVWSARTMTDGPPVYNFN